MLGSEEWYALNHLLFEILDRKYSQLMNEHSTITDHCYVDKRTFLILRRYLDDTYPWGYVIFDPKYRPLPVKAVAQEIIPKRGVRPKRKEPYADIIYQVWRGKYNNISAKLTANYEAKKERQREKLCTKRRSQKLISRVTEEGYLVGKFGTLEGQPVFNKCPQSSRDAYKKLLAEMRKKKADRVSTSYLKTELLRLWDIHYSVVHSSEAALLVKVFKTGGLASMRKFIWYEAYANKICQLQANSKDFFLENLYSIGAVMGDLFKNAKKPYVKYLDNQVEAMPCIVILICIASYLGESTKFVVSMTSTQSAKNEDIVKAVADQQVCSAIVNKDYYGTEVGAKNFCVCTRDIPFIEKLTEEQACYVYATASDVFNFHPDQGNNQKGKRIFLLNEFMRRHLLCIQDFCEYSKNELQPMHSLAAKWQQLRGTSRGVTKQMAIDGLKRAQREAEKASNPRKYQKSMKKRPDPDLAETLSQVSAQSRASQNASSSLTGP